MFVQIKSIRFMMLIVLAIGMLTSSSCMSMLSLKEIEDVKSLGKEDVILVGRVQIVPQLASDEQVIRGVLGMDGYYLGKFVLERSNIKSGDLSSRLSMNALLEKQFYLKGESKSFYIVGGRVLMKMIVRQGSKYTGESASTTESWLGLKGKFRVKVPSKARAIYIGTIRYNRDEFNNVTKVKVLDHYKKDKKLFYKKFGKKIKLHKSLALRSK